MCHSQAVPQLYLSNLSSDLHIYLVHLISLTDIKLHTAHWLAVQPTALTLSLELLFALKDTGNDCIDVLSTAGVFAWGDTVALPPTDEDSGLKPVVGAESRGAA